MKILLVDDHVLSRDGLREVLKELKNDAIVLEASDCHKTMQLVGENPDLDLILLDISLPDGNGLGMLTQLRQRYPSVAVVVLSGYHDRENVVTAIKLGALGFIPKSAQRSVILGALRFILAGGIYVPPEILSSDPLPNLQLRAPNAAEKVPSPSEIGLTGRQLEVLRLMMEGMGNKAISRALDLTEATVKNHVTAVLKALNVTNRTEAVVVAGKYEWE